MVVVLYVVFPVRRRLMALPVVVVGVLFTFGITGAAGVSLTLVTMAGLPILLGLGMDFAIQFHNRYEEELARGDTPAAGMIDALTHIGPVVGTAVLATILGFVTLGLSSVPGRPRLRRPARARRRRSSTSSRCSSLNALLYRFDKGRPAPTRQSDPAATRRAAAPAGGPTPACSRPISARPPGRHLVARSVQVRPAVLAVAIARRPWAVWPSTISCPSRPTS